MTAFTGKLYKETRNQLNIVVFMNVFQCRLVNNHQRLTELVLPVLGLLGLEVESTAVFRNVSYCSPVATA